MKGSRNNIKELWDFLFKVFPIVDLPFSVLAIYSSDHWLITLIIAILFPIVASTVFYFSNKKGFQPGYLIMSINGLLFIPYMYYSGANSPTWLNVIVITVGSSFMFNNPKVGQYMVAIWSFCIGMFYYSIGASIEYSLLITFVILGFVILFSRAFAYLQKQQAKIEEKNKEIENKSKDITDSINYAKRIQYAVLPHEETIYRNIPLSFIFYKPKDIVSGDFFWFHEINRDEYILVCADCTGHGVPGAFMTVIGSSLLNQTVIDNKIDKPAAILTELDKQINFTLKQQKDGDLTVQDGMDLTLIRVNKLKKELIITSAKRPVILIRNKEIQEFKGSKFSLGGMRSGDKVFEEIVINYQEEDLLCMFTDGYADQFGGDKAKKFSSKRLRELLVEIHRAPMNDQKNRLASTISNWQGELEQIDDMLVMGIKF
ncbi:MAG: PP2C family protein-serine/threonine phosphatase [Sphingobacteriaceae bacterium]|jgi:serine phosphatase RsbU (regulator of sigma subunit)